MSLKYTFLCIVILYSMKEVYSKFEFTNIKCTSLDPDFCNFEYCRLKSVNRTYKYVTLKVNLYKIPITKAGLNFAFFKRYNGYQPFLYNISVDVCKVIKYPKSNPVFTFAHSLFRDSSNINHTCPYNNDLIVDKLSAEFVNTQFTKTLPFPQGDYLFQTIWLADNIRRAEVKVYGTLS